MVSDDTQTRTQEMLEEAGWFGMEQGQVTLMKQEKVAALQVQHKLSLVLAVAVTAGRACEELGARV